MQAGILSYLDRSAPAKDSHDTYESHMATTDAGNDGRSDCLDAAAAKANVLLAYDARMLDHTSGVREKPGRLTAIMKRLQKSELLQQCQMPAVQPASDAQLLTCHSQSHVDNIMSASAQAVREGREINVGESIAANKHSALCARLAAGACVQVAEAVVRGEARRGVALVRPPGHHAKSNTAQGFCVFNNAAVAARAAQGAGAQRVLIFYWDVHHGDGTQNLFADDADVLFMSVHRHDNGKFYPGTGAHTEVGIGNAKGRSVNIPWEQAGMENADYMAALEGVVLPITKEFDPDLIIISAGFDAAAGDPIGGCKVTQECFAIMTAKLQGLAPIAMLLEGGYKPSAVASATEACLRVLLGQPAPELPHPARTASGNALRSIKQVIDAQAPYWRCMHEVQAKLQASGLSQQGPYAKVDSSSEGSTGSPGRAVPTGHNQAGFTAGGTAIGHALPIRHSQCPRKASAKAAANLPRAAAGAAGAEPPSPPAADGLSPQRNCAGSAANAATAAAGSVSHAKGVTAEFRTSNKAAAAAKASRRKAADTRTSVGSSSMQVAEDADAQHAEALGSVGSKRSSSTAFAQGEELGQKKKRKTQHISSDAQNFVPQFQHATLAKIAVRKKSRNFTGKVKGGIAKPTKRKAAQQGVAAAPEGVVKKRSGVAEPTSGRRRKLKGPCDECLVDESPTFRYGRTGTAWQGFALCNKHWCQARQDKLPPPTAQAEQNRKARVHASQPRVAAAVLPQPAVLLRHDSSVPSELEQNHLHSAQPATALEPEHLQAYTHSRVPPAMLEHAPLQSSGSNTWRQAAT